MLVSDPLQCQEGDGELSFRYWTSPRTSIRVCIRNVSTIKRFDWCSADITKGDPGPSVVQIPGSIMDDFEIVIEARNFSYDAFGQQGGVVIIDDIKYNASAIYNCRNIPHVNPPVPLSDKTCLLLNCEFESDQTECVERLGGSGWRRSEKPTGNLHTGIRSLKSGAFVFVKGRMDDGIGESEAEEVESTIETTEQETTTEPEETTTEAYRRRRTRETKEDEKQDEKLRRLIEKEDRKIEGTRLRFGDFEVPRQLILEFCIYMTSEGSRLVVESEMKGYCRSRLVEFGQIGLEPHRWSCYRLFLHAGYYKALDFVAYQMDNPYSYIGLDGLKLYEADNQRCACPSLCSMDDSVVATMLNSSAIDCSNQFNAFNCAFDSTSNYQPDSQKLPALIQSPQLDLSNGKFVPDSKLVSSNRGNEEGAQESAIEQAVSTKSQESPEAPTLSVKITKTGESIDASRKKNLINSFESDNIQIPPSFALQKDNSYTPLAVPTPTLVRFGGLDDNLQPLDFSSELKQLPQRRRIKF